VNQLPTIYLADSDPYIHNLLEVTFPAAEFSFSGAVRGMQAVEHLRAHTPNLLLLDAELPEVGGLELCGRLKRMARFKHVPVIVLAPALDPRTKDGAILARADKVIDKPISAKHLLILVRNMLRQAQEQQMHVTQA
jgi:DNA-binding response OmpR family regulator